MRQREARIEKLVTSCLRIAGQSVFLAMDQGDDLLTARANLTHGQWLPWLEANFPKHQRTAYRYIALAEKRRELGSDFFRSARTIEDAFKILGILPPTEPKKLIGPANTCSPILDRLRFVAEWVTKEGVEAVNGWEEPTRKQFKQDLRPVVELYERL